MVDDSSELVDTVSQLNGNKEQNAFNSMVHLIAFECAPTTHNNNVKTLIGYDLQRNWHGADAVRGSERIWKQAAADYNFASSPLLTTTTIDLQTKRSDGNTAVVHLQMYAKPNRKTVASVVLPTTSPVGVDVVKKAFFESQARLETYQVAEAVTGSNGSMRGQSKVDEGSCSVQQVDSMETVDIADLMGPTLQDLADMQTQPRKATGAGFRTTWTDNCGLGKGFHREVSVPAKGTAIIYNHPDTDPDLVCDQIQGEIKLLSTSKEFTDIYTAGGGVSMEGWGISADATTRATDRMIINSKTLTGVVCMRYMSEPIVVVETAKRSAAVALTASAKKLLTEKGPKEFHKEFGSHFIAGYTKGGELLGSYNMIFSSEQHARQHLTSIKAKFEGLAFKAGGSAEFNKELDSIQELTERKGQYWCRGWSSDHPPQLICSLEDLAAAHNQFNPSNGIKMEAVLMRYSHINDYVEARNKYFEDKPGGDTYGDVFIGEEKFGTVTFMLNGQYTQLMYLCRLLEDQTAKNLVAIYKEALAVKIYYERLLRVGTDGLQNSNQLQQVRDVYKALEIFLLNYNGVPEDEVYPADKEWWQKGKQLVNKLWCAGKLETAAEACLPTRGAVPPPIPKNLGNGWTTDTSDGHLRFSYNKHKKFVLYNEKRGDRVWASELGYLGDTMVKNNDTITLKSEKDGRRLQNRDDFTVDVAAVRGWWRLDRPAAFSNENTGNWERMVVEKR